MKTPSPLAAATILPTIPSFSLRFMAAVTSLLFLFLSLHLSPASAARHHSSAPTLIKRTCRAVRFPDMCNSSLSSSSATSPVKVVAFAISVSSDSLHKGQALVKSLLDSTPVNPNRTFAANSCLEFLDNSDYRTEMAVEAMSRGNLKDARAWLTASLVFQYSCWSRLKYANDTKQVSDAMDFLNTITMITSNSLSILRSYDIYGKKTSKWSPPKTERDGFWENGVRSSSGTTLFPGGVPKNLVPDITVCKDGSNGCYKTIQKAVDSAPNDLAVGKRYVIKINKGVYEEIVRVPREKKNVVFLGDGMGETVITGSLDAGQIGVTTFSSATLGVLGDGFMASNLTIQNTAGPVMHQAVAYRSDSDQSVLENCELLGNQDTLYANSLRQYYKSCRIEGNVDFIFGTSASVFENCTILIRPRMQTPEYGENNAVTAHGRTDPAQTAGFVFRNCLINGTDAYMALYQSNPRVHKNFLGRPWKEYSRTVFIGCILEALISPPGWMPFSGDLALATLYYGEFNNSGLGSNTTQRVLWSNQIAAKHVNTYSVRNFIQGDQWIPTTA